MPKIDRPWVSVEEQEEDLIFLDLLKEIDYDTTDSNNILIDGDNDTCDCSCDCFD